MVRKRRQKMGRLEPDRNLRLAEGLADRAFDTANEAIQMIRAGHCGTVVEKLNNAAAFYGKADGHYANMERSPGLEETLGRAWRAVQVSSGKFYTQCVRRKR